MGAGRPGGELRGAGAEETGGSGNRGALGFGVTIRVLKPLALTVLLAAACPPAGTQTPGAPAAARRLNDWIILGPGGGGAQFFPTVSPHDPKTVLVRCDMTGGYITRDGGESWRMFNLAGPPRFFLFDPGNRTTIYAQTGALWRSLDLGRSWARLFPAAVSELWMPDDHAGVRYVTSEGPAPPMAALAIHPRDSRRLYAAMAGGLHVSSDRGGTWQREADLPAGVTKLLFHPKTGALYAVGRDSVAVNENGQWQRYATPAAFLDVSGTPPLIYGVTETAVHVTRDGGATWKSSGPQARFRAIGACATRPEVAYVSYSQLGEERFFGVAKTADGGDTWDYVWKESRTPAPNVDGSWITERFGPGWASNPIHIGVAPTDPNLVFTTDYGRTMRSRDGGRTWQGVYSRKLPGGYTTTGLDVTTSYGVHFDPFDRKRIFITYTDIGLFGSDDGGVTWRSATVGVPRPWVNTTYWMEFDPKVKGRVWAVASGIHDLPRPKMWRGTGTARYNGGVIASDDGGRTWRVASDALPPTAATHVLLDPESPVEARTLYVAGFARGVFKSTDGGTTWALKNHGIEGAAPFAWRLARDGKGALYLVVARASEDGGHGNAGDGAIYRSRDHAESWEKLPLPEGLNGPNGLAIDPRDPNRLYLAAWGRRTRKSAVQGGIWLTTDAGRSWRSIHDADQHVYDVTIDPRDPDILYACGFESAAWRSTDHGQTWGRIPGYDFKWGHRVIPDPYRAGWLFITTFGGSVWYGKTP